MDKLHAILQTPTTQVWTLDFTGSNIPFSFTWCKRSLKMSVDNFWEATPFCAKKLHLTIRRWLFCTRFFPLWQNMFYVSTGATVRSYDHSSNTPANSVTYSKTYECLTFANVVLVTLILMPLIRVKNSKSKNAYFSFILHFRIDTLHLESSLKLFRKKYKYIKPITQIAFSTRAFLVLFTFMLRHLQSAPCVFNIYL